MIGRQQMLFLSTRTKLTSKHLQSHIFDCLSWRREKISFLHLAASKGTLKHPDVFLFCFGLLLCWPNSIKSYLGVLPAPSNHVTNENRESTLTQVQRSWSVVLEDATAGVLTKQLEVGSLGKHSANANDNICGWNWGSSWLAIILRADRITGRSLPRSNFAKLSLRPGPRPPTREQVKINEVANCCQNFVTAVT